MAAWKTLIRETRGNAGYDAFKELVKLFLPAFAGSITTLLGAHLLIVWFAVLIAAVVVTLADSGRRRKARAGPLEIEEARWVCVNDPKAYRDVTKALQGMINHDGLDVLLNNEILGDPCLDHADKGGHGKRLELRYAYKGFVVVPPNERLFL